MSYKLSQLIREPVWDLLKVLISSRTFMQPTVFVWSLPDRPRYVNLLHNFTRKLKDEPPCKIKKMLKPSSSLWIYYITNYHQNRLWLLSLINEQKHLRLWLLQQPGPVCTLRWHSDSEGSCNWGDKERRAREVLTIPRQQGSISRETKGTQWFIQQKEGEQRQRGIIRKGHPQFLSRNDLFPLCNKHLSDPFIGFIRSDSLVKPFPAAAAGPDS